jgi:WD40 repeat protein
MFFDSKSLETTRKIKAHNDCINDIKISDSIMTASNDGHISVLDISTGNKLQTVELGFPIKQIQKFRSKFYLAGVRSF